MTLPSKELVRIALWIAGGAATVGTTAWRVYDARYVHQSDYDKARLVEKVEHDRDDAERSYIRVHLDSANLRLQQIQCGKRIETGCR